MARTRRTAVSTTRVGRSVQPAILAMQGTLRWLATYRFRGERRTAARKDAVLRSSEDVTRALGEMKGAAMKIGQVLSLMTGAVPDELTGQLATLHNAAPPMAYPLVVQVFREEHGKTPTELFRHFERVPFAAASIGQVHRAELRDGTQVAVKVQYPGVREAIGHDLANVGLLLRFGGMVATGLDIDSIAGEIRTGIANELDYRREAANQQRFHELFEGHAFIRIPRVFNEHSTGRILVQEYIDGEPLSAIYSRSQAEQDRVAEIIYRFAFGSLYRHGLFNGDPHPGNYLLTPDGCVAFVDFGQVAEFDPVAVAKMGAVIEALLQRDIHAWRVAVEELGILHRGAPFSTEDIYEHMHWYWAPIIEDRVKVTPELAGEMVRRNTQTAGLGGEINKHCNVPEGTVFLTRINFGLAGLMGRLNAEAPWRGIISEYVRGTPPATELGHASAATSRGPGV